MSDISSTVDSTASTVEYNTIHNVIMEDKYNTKENNSNILENEYNSFTLRNQLLSEEYYNSLDNRNNTFFNCLKTNKILIISFFISFIIGIYLIIIMYNKI
jgi:hypothetical protein